MKKIVLILILLFLTGFIFSKAWADEPAYDELLREIERLKTRVTDLESKLVSQDKKVEEKKKKIKETRNLLEYKPGEGITVEAAGLNIGASGVFVFQGTPNANNVGEGNEDSIFDASYKANIEIEKEFDDWGLAFLELEAGENDSIESELSLFSNVNQAASDTGAHVDVNKLWYEHHLFNKQLAVTLGKVEACGYMDQNEYACDECTQFLTHMFKKSPVVEFPTGNGPGLHINVSPEAIKALEFDAGIFEGDADWDDVFDQMFYMAQVNVKTVEILGIDPEQWGGNYRLYFWLNDRFHEKIVDEGDPASEDTKESNWGIGISCDQMVTDVFGVFTRLGWQRPDVLPAGASADDIADNPALEFSWSLGGQARGKYWMRPEDVFGIAVGQVFPSEEYEDAGQPSKGESHLEMYYNMKINECLSISPDIQVIWNPNGVGKESEGDDDTIFVYGARAYLEF